MKKRTKIPQKTETEVLFINDRTCCVCRNKKKGVCIHHIDDNPSNNDISNLSVVCTECHDLIHKKGGTTKGISPSLLLKYKHEWETSIKYKRTPETSPLKSESGIEKILFKFEIRKKIFELQALDDNDLKSIKENLEFYESLYLIEGQEYINFILGNLKDTVLVLSINSINKTKLIAEYLHHYFYHLIGPHEVKITQEDKKNIELTISILETIGQFSGEFNRHKSIFDKLEISLRNILDIIIWYNLTNLVSSYVKTIKEISKGCLEKYDGEIFVEGLKKMNKLIDYSIESIHKEKPDWKAILDKLKKTKQQLTRTIKLIGLSRFLH
jgi:hypothetical protein